MKRFVALKDFWSVETQSMYAKGLSYQVQPALEVFLIDKWKRAGLIEMVDDRPLSAVGGQAECR